MVGLDFLGIAGSGIAVKMITGDHAATGLAIAKLLPRRHGFLKEGHA